MKRHTFSPDEIIFAPTASCNLSCPHCFTKKSASKLSSKDAAAFLATCKNSVINKVGFSGGGEPFLAVDFMEEIIRYSVENGFLFGRITTNGAWWKTEEELREKLMRIYDAGFDGKFGVSYDTFHAQKFEKVLSFIKAAHEIFGGYSVEIQSVVEKDGISKDKTDAFEANFQRLAKELNSQLNEETGGSKTVRIFSVTDSEGIFIPIFRTPETLPPEKSEAWKSRKWFKDDYCEGPGHVLFVQPDGNIAPCCGFANENSALFIGKITDTLEKVLENAEKNPLASLCYEKGLSKGIKLLKKNGAALPGKTDDPCTLCGFLCAYAEAHKLFGGN